MDVSAFRDTSSGPIALSSGPIGRPNPRRTELVLCVAAVALVAVAGLGMSAATGGGDGDSLQWALGVFAVLTVLAHLAVRIFASKADPVLLPCVVLLNGLGLVIIDRLDRAEAANAVALGKPVPSSDAAHQLIWTAAGIVLFAAVLVVIRNHGQPAKYAYTCGLAGIVLLLIPAVLPSRFSEVNGGKSWIMFHGFSIQPGEFAKVLLLIFVAGFLVANRDLFGTAGKRFLGYTLPRLRDLGPLLLVTFVSVLVLVYEKNLGFSLLVFGTVLAMVYVATRRASWLLIGIGMFAVGAVVAYHLFAHVRVRVQVWEDPFATYYTNGYQIAQGLFGLGTGGLLGAGLGGGRPQEVPFAKTDFIISTIGEELGLIGLSAVIVVFAIITMRGFTAALTTRDSFGKLLGGGLAFSLGWQLFVVVGGVTKLIPLTGLTTPFMSYGGSSLLANYVIVALLIRISHDARSEAAPAPPPVAPIAEAMTEHIRQSTPPRRVK
ncbi:FtsW/RodA/SpoVE family cell cycle protein [Nocardia terpenica]|uniref:FtsW/RodA/SpoVE family cell cycle protein n=1 Tax=Nocardia terpenica TaxID=455432 RepID=UPI001894F946|nr:FtsW/RodA/SpoVE family cell cycle protein [Nocardia terpenica]MBF6103080.1 FtsW/RodA/SpoVE family cell cycle protein [Nocardia terpenica]MBF6110731.1 FtsW/RodA/SpoVE family cell cycle protein [Nocardia terpenica]MBF6116862.1 FtsW/RodA/SpoVE family cell cycle protein [Nocardia terpenica]MBF6151300.1 FtsW/RodA/SpoVE family cell cycle protein [Nocardia terpenica]